MGRPGYLTGAGQVTAGLLVAALLGMPINRLTLGLVAAAWLLLGLGVLNRSASLGSITPLVGGDIRAAIPVLVVAMIGLGYIGVTVANGPIDSIDFIGFWGKRGVAMFIDHNLDFHLIHDKDHTYYPLELSNVYGSVDILLGHVNDQVIRLPLAAFAAALAASTWWLCRLAMPPLAAAVAVALPITTQQYAASTGSGLADMVMTAYVTVCALACFLDPRDDPRWAALAGVAAGGAAWTKIEGTPTAAVILLTAVLLRRRISRDVFVAFVLFAFFGSLVRVPEAAPSSRCSPSVQQGQPPHRLRSSLDLAPPALRPRGVGCILVDMPDGDRACAAVLVEERLALSGRVDVAEPRRPWARTSSPPAEPAGRSPSRCIGFTSTWHRSWPC